ncbi:MAG: mechanosensitive ion channel domain-containing protein [Sandaracinaceae bacterium]
MDLHSAGRALLIIASLAIAPLASARLARAQDGGVAVPVPVPVDVEEEPDAGAEVEPDTSSEDDILPDVGVHEPTHPPPAFEAPAPTATSSHERPEPLPAAEIGRRIEETFREIQEVTPRLHRQPETLEVRRLLPGFVRSVTALSEDPALEQMESLQVASLHDLQQEWNRVRATLTQWQESLEARSASLAEERTHVVAARRLWRITRDAVREEPLPESQLTRIDALLERIEIVVRRIDLRLDEVLSLQGELSDQGIRIARFVARIQAAQDNARARRERRDHRPLWLGWNPLDDDAPEGRTLSEVLDEHTSSLETFLTTEKKGLLWHALAFALLVGLFVAMRRGTHASLAPGRPSVHRALRARPIATATLFALILAPIAYRYVPVIAVAASLLVLVPTIDLLSRHVLPAGRRTILALNVLAALSIPVTLGFVTGAIAQFYILALQIAATITVAALFLPRLRAATASNHAPTRKIYWLLRASIIPLGASLYFLLSGYIERAQLWTVATLWALMQGIGLFLAAELLSGVALFGLRRRRARLFHVVRSHRRKVAYYLLPVIRWSAGVAFVYLALRSFDLVDPAIEEATLALRRTFEFGSIELSFGEILAFLGMLLGTFLTMRLTHALLEHEVLPRFSLEQGIVSAISLSVSYLLVAIGVVLAFGVAGVDPERLALLGGALGVGIGFGLQNVVSNFVSGLILVAERPIKVGDIIEVGELVGRVQRIGIRSSTIHSLDGADVIVPNADLISGRLVNWTLDDPRRRMHLAVGVAYSHDPKAVMAILQKVARSSPGLLSDPAPDVICTGFGDSSIDYEIRAWTPGYLEAIRAKSLLAERVYEALGNEGVEIPFPQRDLHLRSVSGEALAQLRAAPAKDEPSEPTEEE